MHNKLKKKKKERKKIVRGTWQADILGPRILRHTHFCLDKTHGNYYNLQLTQDVAIRMHGYSEYGIDA